MKIRAQTSTALRALLDLCLHTAPQSPASLNEIGSRQGLSVAFLEQLFRRLKSAALVAPWRGMKGGYTLARPADQVSLWEVLRALEDPLVKPVAAEKGGAPEEQVLRQCFARLEGKWEEDLKGLSLADLRDEARGNPALAGVPREGVGFEI